MYGFFSFTFDTYNELKKVLHPKIGNEMREIPYICDESDLSDLSDVSELDFSDESEYYNEKLKKLKKRKRT
jgi:hypothetical protein